MTDTEGNKPIDIVYDEISREGADFCAIGPWHIEFYRPRRPADSHVGVICRAWYNGTQSVQAIVIGVLDDDDGQTHVASALQIGVTGEIINSAFVSRDIAYDDFISRTHQIFRETAEEYEADGGSVVSRIIGVYVREGAPSTN